MHYCITTSDEVSRRSRSKEARELLHSMLTSLSLGNPPKRTIRSGNSNTSFSYSGPLTCVAYEHNSAIGVDIEVVSKTSLEHADSALTDEERAHIPLCQDVKLEALKIWCAKEAVVKAKGTGFVVGPEEVLLTRVKPNLFREEASQIIVCSSVMSSNQKRLVFAACSRKTRGAPTLSCIELPTSFRGSSVCS